MTKVYGYCECGCGQKTNLAAKTDRQAGWVRGEPLRFIGTHGLKRFHHSGPKHNGWRGGKKTKQHGYVVLLKPDHVHADKDGYVYEHIFVAATALGKPLPPFAIVHHINTLKSDNSKTNLVICQDQKYHQLLHIRMRALAASGNPNFRQCSFCRGWDEPSQVIEIYQNGQRHSAYHRLCWNAKAREQRRRAREKLNDVSL